MDMRSARSVTVLVGVPPHDATRFAATFAPRWRTGQQIEVVVDTESRHFFDPETGLAIRA